MWRREFLALLGGAAAWLAKPAGAARQRRHAKVRPMPHAAAGRFPMPVIIDHSGQSAGTSITPAVFVPTLTINAATRTTTVNVTPAAGAFSFAALNAQQPGPGEWPDASNTGITGVGLTTADLTRRTTTLDTVGTGTAGSREIYDRIWVDGANVNILHPYVTFTKCLIRGRVDVDVSYSDDRRPLFEDCEIDGNGTQGTAGNVHAIGPHSYRVSRCNIHSANDCMKAHGWCDIEDSYIHDPIRFTGAHADAIQNSGNGTGRTGPNILRCAVYGPYRQTNAAVQMGSSAGPITDAVVDSCFLSGGNIPVRMLENPNPISGCRLTNNTFEKDSYTLTEWQLDSSVVHFGNVLSDGTALD